MRKNLKPKAYIYPLPVLIIGTYDENGIPNQTKTTVAGGNNAGAMQGRHTGVKMTAVSLPCRYIHSSACMGKVQDVQAMYDLLMVLAEELTK